MYELTEEGKEYLKEGLPEKQLLKKIKSFLISKKPLEEIKKMPHSEIAIAWARKNGWAQIVGDFIELTKAGADMAEKRTPLELALGQVAQAGDAEGSEIKILLSRGLIEKIRERKIAQKEIAQLSPGIIVTGEWKNIPFRKYDVSTPAPVIWAGKKQPYVQFIEDVKAKLVGLGFQEVSGPLVELSFWNCDALFTPQDHPAKSIHDIFYLKCPQNGKLPDKSLVAKVKATHQNGWTTGSTGWGGTWDEGDASNLIMRSHTTPVSARTLFKLGETTGKYFTISKNFRPDIIDAKHLMEFYQCEGIVVGKGLTFRHLLGYLKELASAVGIKEVRFKPGYFPFTEPSVEGYINHPKLGWIEALPAGLLRPEVLKPLGIENAQVLAWGLGIDRLAMAKLGIDDIRLLFTDNLDWLRKSSLVI